MDWHCNTLHVICSITCTISVSWYAIIYCTYAASHVAVNSQKMIL